MSNYTDDILSRASHAFNAGNLGQLYELVEEAADAADEDHNGWTNRETWAVALHLSNDEDLYRATLDLMDPDGKQWSNGDRIEDWVTGQVERQLFPAPGDEPDPWAELWRSMISDVGSFWRVDWSAVAASFAEDVAS